MTSHMGKNSSAVQGKNEMAIKRRKIDNRIERKILIGMIVSDKYLRDVQTIYSDSLIEIPFVRIIAHWCFDYYKSYDAAPKNHIEDIFKSNARNQLDDDSVELIEDFLSEISSEYERSDKFNAEYLLDQTETYFKKKSLQVLSEDIKANLISGDTTEAEALLGKYKRIQRPAAKGINPFVNSDAIFKAFENRQKGLFTFPNALGNMINEELTRDGFIGIMGPEKRGKTWWLMEFAFRAARARCNVAFFQVGDMSESQMIRRKLIRLAGRSDRERHCGRVLIPVMDCAWNQDDSCTMRKRTCDVGLIEDDEKLSFDDAPDDYSPCTYCRNRFFDKYKPEVWFEERHVDKPLTWKEGYKLGKKFVKRMRGRDFKLSTHPNSSINVQGIKAHLDVWEDFEDFLPDVIIIDYADILAPEPGAKEFRHQQNETWKALRALSQERHCLIITATQSDAASYNVDLLRMKHYSEDKRKYAHVTGMVGLNQTEEEKDKGIMRLNWLALREGEFKVARTVKVLQCLKIGKPYLDSFN